MTSGNAFWVLALLLLVALALLSRRFGGVRYPKGDLPYFSRKRLLSHGELAFFRTLENAVPSTFMVCPKVRLSDIINCSDAAWRQGFGGRISQKHVDFVLIERSSAAIVCAIELDDRSHQKSARRDRDEFVDRALRAAGISVLRFKAQSHYDRKAVSNEIQGVLYAKTVVHS